MAHSQNDGQLCLRLVMKLNGKIKDADYMKEDKLLKILNQLLHVNMTLDILQRTHVGVTINPLRKVNGKVGKTAKELIKKWKQLLPTTDPAPVNHKVIEKEQFKHSHNAVERGKGKLSANINGTTSSTSNKGTLNDKQPHPIPHPPVVASFPSSSGQSSKLHTSKMIVPSNSDFSEEADSIAGIPRKRKLDIKSEESQSAVAASTKRSRMQVYSGKSAGLKYVPKLFDICMTILIDNIDAIDEVGGVPFFVLEPVLSKCTPTQLLRLEEYNPHFIEDSDSLWEKHVLKEFKSGKPSKGKTWRDLYLAKVEEREHKMKSITSIIKARQQAREEPVRKAAILNSAPLPPSRQRNSMRFNNYRGGPTSMEPQATNLMRQTLKMAKNRHMMIGSRPKR